MYSPLVLLSNFLVCFFKVQFTNRKYFGGLLLKEMLVYGCVFDCFSPVIPKMFIYTCLKIRCRFLPYQSRHLPYSEFLFVQQKIHFQKGNVGSYLGNLATVHMPTVSFKKSCDFWKYLAHVLLVYQKILS